MKLINYAVLTSVFISHSAFGQSDIELTTFWGSQGEKSALDEIVKPLQENGISAEVIYIDGYSELRQSISERISIDQPPEVSHWLWGDDLTTLSDTANLVPLPPQANGQAIDDVLLPEILNAIEKDGAYIALPIGVHLQGIMLYNMQRLSEVGVGTPPKNWDEFFAAAEKLQANGVIPIAQSDEFWMFRSVFDAALSSIGGSEAFNDLYQDFDASGNFLGTLEETLNVINKYKLYADAGAEGREWWQLVDMVTTGEAAMGMMGDFAQAQISTHPENVTKNIVCGPIPGQQVANFGVDVFVTFDSQIESWRDDYQTYIDTVLSKDVQARYLAIKGGLPVIQGIEPKDLEQCAANSLSIWKNSQGARTAVPPRDNVGVVKFFRITPALWANETKDSSTVAAIAYDYFGGKITEAEFFERMK